MVAWKIVGRGTTLLGVAAAVFTTAARAADGFAITSPGAIEGGTLPPAYVLDGFGCHGDNHSPPLAWTRPPPATRSLAITMFDPDAPTGSGWWHWTVFNLPPSTRELPEGAGRPASGRLPTGAVQGRTDFGTTGYGGACPPAGHAAHHYVISVWALDVDRLPLDARASGAMVGFVAGQHVIGKAMLTLRYGR